MMEIDNKEVLIEIGADRDNTKNRDDSLGKLCDSLHLTNLILDSLIGLR